MQKMDQIPYRGQLAVVELKDVVSLDQHFKLIGLVRTGSMEGQQAYVAYKGNPNVLVGKDIVARFDYAERGFSLDSKGSDPTYYFVTSSLPPWFDFGASEQIILWAIWEKRMQNGFDAPIIGKLVNFFNVGYMPLVLHFADREGYIIPYKIGRRNEIMRKGQFSSIRNPGNALRSYLRNMSGPKRRVSGHPKVVSLNEGLERRVSVELNNILTNPEFGIKGTIQMEPQQ